MTDSVERAVSILCNDCRQSTSGRCWRHWQSIFTEGAVQKDGAPGFEPVAQPLDVGRHTFFVPTAIEGENTIASEILRQTARMRRDGSFEKDSLCWSPAELELLAMFAIYAKNKLKA